MVVVVVVVTEVCVMAGNCMDDETPTLVYFVTFIVDERCTKNIGQMKTL